MTGLIVDLYAGPGGWDEGMRLLGLTNAVGIEWDAAACDTAAAAGHRRIQADVSTYAIAPFAGVSGLVASPPCQAWSMAGKRQGERDRSRVHELVDAYARGSNDPGAGWVDERSHHAAQPVRWVRELRPEWVALEQVPPVLGLWQHIAERFRRWGYATWTGVLNAADYGVPQTRERAFLLASRTGPALPPAPTHTRNPAEDLFGARLEPWVSMAEALDWPGVDRPARTICGDRSPRWAYGQANSYSTGWTLETENRSETAAGRVPYLRDSDRPAPTVVGNADRWEVHRRTNSADGRGGSYPTPPVPADRPAPTVTGQAGNQWILRNGNQSNAAERGAAEPAPTMAFGHNAARVEWVLRNGNQDNACARTPDEPAGTLFFGQRANWVGWVHQRPATTIQGDPRLGRPGHGDREAGESQFERGSVKITQVEASILQSFPPDYPWQGTKTKRFEQIGNAVPPLLAAAVVGALTAPGDRQVAV